MRQHERDGLNESFLNVKHRLTTNPFCVKKWLAIDKGYMKRWSISQLSYHPDILIPYHHRTLLEGDQEFAEPILFLP